MVTLKIEEVCVGCCTSFRGTQPRSQGFSLEGRRGKALGTRLRVTGRGGSIEGVEPLGLFSHDNENWEK